jgi:hypothetical protein
MIRVPNTPVSYSGGELNMEMWYMLDPPTGTNYAVAIPNGGTDVLQVVLLNASASLGNIIQYASMSAARGDSANPVTTMGIGAPAGDGGMFHAYSLGTGYRNSPTSPTQLQIAQYDAGAYSMNQCIQSQSTAAAISFGYTCASDTWAGVIGAFNEKSSAPPAAPTPIYFINWIDSDIRIKA